MSLAVDTALTTSYSSSMSLSCVIFDIHSDLPIPFFGKIGRIAPEEVMLQLMKL